MIPCSRCNVSFRDKWTLDRHLLRKKQCVLVASTNSIPENNQKNFPEEKKNLPEEKQAYIEDNKSLPEEGKTYIENKKSLPKEENDTCKYCLKSFYNNGNMKKHYLTCKLKNDPVRILEIEKNILPSIPVCSTECRFCKKLMSRVSTLTTHLLTCKAKQDYLSNLSKPTINNNSANVSASSNQSSNSIQFPTPRSYLCRLAKYKNHFWQSQRGKSKKIQNFFNFFEKNFEFKIQVAEHGNMKVKLLIKNYSTNLF